MIGRDLEVWMWAEAARRLERAERLQRQFFRSGPQPPRQWEPPADIFETADAVRVVIALPGVTPDRLTGFELRDNPPASTDLIVTGDRPLPTTEPDATLHRLEIPHGRFERHVTLPCGGLALTAYELRDGCLYLTLDKR